MIISALYLLCFLILILHNDKDIRAVACVWIAHIFCENSLYYWFSVHPEYFNLDIYFLACWFLDILGLFLSACLLSGRIKKITLFLTIPVLFSQMMVVQAPGLIPPLFPFVISDAYPTMMEIVVLCASLKDTTVKEWLRTISILALLVGARFIHTFIY